MVTINGTDVPAAGCSLADYLQTTEFDPKRIAIEQNGRLVPRGQYDKTTLCDGDVIEIVSFVGGG